MTHESCVLNLVRMTHVIDLDLYFEYEYCSIIVGANLPVLPLQVLNLVHVRLYAVTYAQNGFGVFHKTYL